MNAFNVIEIAAAITTHARFIDRPAAVSCGVGYYAITKKGKRAGVQIYEIQPADRNGRIRVSFAAHDGSAGTYGAHDDAWPFTVTFGPSPHGDEYTEIRVDTGTGPGSQIYTIRDHDPARTVANRIIRYVCAAHDIGGFEK